MEKKLGYNIYQCQMVSSGVVSNGVEWCGVKWCRVSVMTLESLVMPVSPIQCLFTIVNSGPCNNYLKG